MVVVASDDALEFDVHVRPGARRASIGGCHDDVLVVRTAAQPIDGRANDEVESTVAEAFGVRRSAVSIVRGSSSRRKHLRVTGDPTALMSRLDELRAGPSS